MQLPLPQHVYKRLLQRLTSTVIPNLRNPLLLSDFLTRSIDQGGLVGILSLHGLFILVTQHGFEYPQFYQRLYNLMAPQVRPLLSPSTMQTHGARCIQLIMSHFRGTAERGITVCRASVSERSCTTWGRDTTCTRTAHVDDLICICCYAGLHGPASAQVPAAD